MDNFAEKSKELTSLITSLQQQGEDNSDLDVIIAQLEAAVAKRATTERIVEVQAKIEPIDPDHPVITHSESVATDLPSRGKSAGGTKRAASKQSTRSSGRKKKAENIKVDELDAEDYNPFLPDAEKIKLDEIVDATIGDLINPWTGATDAEYDEPAEPQTEEDEDEPSSSASKSTNFMKFNGVCKLCEVIAKTIRDKTEDQPLVAESSMLATPDFPVFSSLVSFANHLKGLHAIQDTEYNQDAPNSVNPSGTKEEADAEGKDSAPKPLYLACPICLKKYNMHGTTKSCYDQLVFHMHRKHAEGLPSHIKLYSCTECSFQTLRRRDLVRHNYVVHTEHESRGVPCEICGKRVLPTSMVFHMSAVHCAENVPEQVKARTARTPCNICGKEFRGEINLQRHIKCVHSKIKEQLCHLCSQSFFAKRELQLHMFANHKINMSNMKVFHCPAEGCNYETLARRHLYIHSAVHTESKDFTCENCGKAFKSKPALTQHLRIMHTNDVEYKCPKCTFSSHAKQYVQRHMVIHSDVKRHKCDFESCTYATHFIENLTKHKRKHRAKDL